jgi:hypothetical protein
MVLKNYQDVTVEAYLNDESIEIERIKDTKNDKLVQIKLVFTMSAFTKCFRPVSNYPSDFADLNVWIRADSSVTFSIPTKKVILIGDGSGNGNGVSKEPSMGQPLRYTYGGGVLDKTMLTFTNDILVSDNNLKTSLANEQFSVFEVSKINAVSNALFGYYHLTDGSLIEMGTNAAGNYEVSVSDGTTTLSEKTATIDTGKFHIASLRKDGATIYLNYYDSGNTFYASDYDGSFDLTKSFEQSKFTVGCVKASNGLIPPSETNARYLDGDFQEVIIYDRKLTDDETAKVVDYLNKKYRIY